MSPVVNGRIVYTFSAGRRGDATPGGRKIEDERRVKNQTRETDGDENRPVRLRRCSEQKIECHNVTSDLSGAPTRSSSSFFGRFSFFFSLFVLRETRVKRSVRRFRDDACLLIIVVLYFDFVFKSAERSERSCGFTATIVFFFFFSGDAFRYTRLCPRLPSGGSEDRKSNGVLRVYLGLL